ncbi:MAG: carboxy terminal-processing peptidase [Bacteroidota bacterium]
MKLKVLVFSAIVASLLIFSSYTFYADEGEKPEVLARLVMKGMSYYHYAPVQLNDEFSSELFDGYLETLDYGKRFFTKSDIKEFSRYRVELDDQLNRGTYEFFDLAASRFNQRMDEAQKMYRKVLDKPFDFSRNESVENDPEKMDYPKSSSDLEDRWRKTLKLQVLSRVTTALERQEKAQMEGKGEAEEIEIKSLAVLEEEARARVLKTHDDWFHRMERVDKAERRAAYLNSVTMLFDPHTNYLPPKDKETFDISISGRLEGIGAQLREEEGFIKVITIVPGSACARQGDLEVNDKILKVAQGEGEPVDVVDMPTDEAVRLIRGKKGTEVRLTVKKIDGSVMVIPIVRDVVELQETYAKSSILQDGAAGEKIGYIHLPKFYIDFNDRFGRRCATDVRKELEKLKAENVNGVILDLRNNGGGSLQDVVEMAGLFVEKGPVVQIKSRDRKPHILNDPDSDVVYDGPLVVLVNSLSASASEILAAAIQDYGRGIIVGTTTFGKGTVQRFVPLDDLIPGYYDIKPLGDVKMTTQKFYRINGGATQLKGVEPDIVLPDNYSKMEIGEREEDHAMAWDEIAPARYNRWDENLNVDKLRKQSADRVADNATFQLISQNAQRLKDNQDAHVFSLNLKDYRAEQDKLSKEAEKYKNISPKIEGLMVSSTATDTEAWAGDEAQLKRIQDWHKRIQKDAYIYESLAIIRDMK